MSEVDQLHSLEKSLRDEFRKGGGISRIEGAIVLARKSLELCPPGHPKRSFSLTYLALLLSDRFTQLGSMVDNEEAMSLHREALELRPKGHPDRWLSLNNLANRISSRYDRLGKMRDLDEAFELSREALDLCPKGHPFRTLPLNSLAIHLSSRHKRLGGMQDLNEAIVMAREALDLRPNGHPGRPMSLNNLAARLATRYHQLGTVQDLNEAIVLNQEALDLRPKGHPDRPMSLNNLAAHLFAQYKQFGAVQDLNEAIILDREALVIFQKGQPGRSMSLNNFAAHLATRYNRLGEIQDLNEAIILDREALGLHHTGHPDRPMSLNSLSVCLFIRYKQLGAMQDLDEAIFLGREALVLSPKGHPGRSMQLNNLAVHLATRYEKLGTLQDLEGAIALDREALNIRPTGHPDRSMSLINLAADLSARYKRLGEIQDLNEGIVLDREALELRPKGHPGRAITLNNLAVGLSTRYKQLEEILDLNDAIALAREALDLRPLGHPDRSRSLVNLTGYLSSRFGQSKQPGDKDEVFSLYAELAHITQIVSSTDLSAARGWIRVAEDCQHPTLLLAYETSLRLLVQHVATLPSLPEHLGIFKNLTSSLAVDAFSACLRSHTPTKAVELLEQGRGVFWSQLSRLRSPVENVVGSGPAGKMLADEFLRLASLVRNALNSPSADQHEQVFRLNLEMQRVVTKIRELPGQSRFLLPSPFSDLRCAAKGGPVIVINASKYSCDALIILLDRDPLHIPLQITQAYVQDLATELSTLTKRSTKGDVTRQLASFLRKLWDQIVRPIVDLLTTCLPAQSRIWWCPTGEFSQLPLHAAGPFRRGQQNLPDLYISSYTPTLSALVRSRQPDPPNPAGERKRFVAIGQGQASGENELPSVGAELDVIEQRISSLATFTRIEGVESCIARVVGELSKSKWVHLSCHGLPNRTEPFESSFALHDGHFTVQRIIGCELKNSEFAYLSACHTTVGYEDSPDEVIHLASAMQFAGFRSVIGTMWAVDDEETSKITSRFYEHLVDESGRLDHTRAAFALNMTMKSVNIPFDQRVLYIHIGA